MVSNYRVIKEVGRGSFGTAQLVTDVRDGERYILKRTRLARQPERQREATIMEMFIQKETRHRNVVRCKESWMEKGFVACLVLEYCVGGELADVLSARRPKELFDEETVRVWFVQVAAALAYLHANSIIHRDVKAANVFVRDDKSLALGDFGLSLTPSTSDELAHTVLGTPQHMAPELLTKNHPTYDEKSDVWALGVLFYEISALKTPFTAFDMKGLTNKICKGATPALPSAFSEEWKELIRSCLRKKPDERPTVSELLAQPVLQPTIEQVSEQYGAEVEEGESGASVVIPEHSCAEILADCKKGSAAARPPSGRLPALPHGSRTSSMPRDRAAMGKSRPVSGKFPSVGGAGASASGNVVRRASASHHRIVPRHSAGSQPPESEAPTRKPRVQSGPSKANKAEAVSTKERIAELESKVGAAEARKPRVPVASHRADRDTKAKAQSQQSKGGASGVSNQASGVAKKEVPAAKAGVEAKRGVGVGRAGQREAAHIKLDGKAAKQSTGANAPRRQNAKGSEQKDSAAARRAAYAKAVARRGPATQGGSKVMGKGGPTPPRAEVEAPVVVGQMESQAQRRDGNAKTRLLGAVAIDGQHDGLRATFKADVRYPPAKPHNGDATGQRGGAEREGQGEVATEVVTECGDGGWEELFDKGFDAWLAAKAETEVEGTANGDGRGSSITLASSPEAGHKGAREARAAPRRPRIKVGVKHFHGVGAMDPGTLPSLFPTSLSPASSKAQLTRKRGAPTLKGVDDSCGVHFNEQSSPLGRPGQRLTSSMHQLARSVEAYSLQPSPYGVKRHHHSIDNSVGKMGQALTSLLES